MKENQYDFQIGDWIICPGADVPRASEVVSIIDDYKYYNIKNPTKNDSYFNGTNTELRLATNGEIIKAGGTIKTSNYEIY